MRPTQVATATATALPPQNIIDNAVYIIVCKSDVGKVKSFYK